MFVSFMYIMFVSCAALYADCTECFCVGVNMLGFTFVRISSLIASCNRLWIGTGNGVILRAPLSESQWHLFAFCVVVSFGCLHMQSDFVLSSM